MLPAALERVPLSLVPQYGHGPHPNAALHCRRSAGLKAAAFASSVADALAVAIGVLRVSMGVRTRKALQRVKPTDRAREHAREEFTPG